MSLIASKMSRLNLLVALIGLSERLESGPELLLDMANDIAFFFVNDPLRDRTPYLVGFGCPVNEFG
jgi:hypothetical protein